ncbi:hypothetical protein MRX96_040427 [Rhipicephalus microplus]
MNQLDCRIANSVNVWVQDRTANSEEQALLSYETARKIIVYPLPKNTNPERDEGRRAARVVVLARQHQRDEGAVYVDATRYPRRRNDFVAAVVRATTGELLTACTVRARTAGQAEEANNMCVPNESCGTLAAVLLFSVCGCFIFSGCQYTPKDIHRDGQVCSAGNEETHCVFQKLAATVVFRHTWNAARYNKTIYAELPRLGKAARSRVLVAALLNYRKRCAAEFLTGSFESTCAYALAVRVRALLQGSIFTKMMRMSPTTLPRYPAGYMVSIVGVDCGVITTTFTVVTRIFFSILFTPVMYYVLWVRVGTIPVLCCVSWHIFVTLLLIPATKLQRKLWGRVIKCRDARLKKVTDILSSIRLVKYYAWEKTFADSLTQLRSLEVNHVFRLNLTDGLLDSLFVSTSSVLAIILFGTWALFNPGKELTASLSFSCIYALSLLDPSCSNIVGMFRLVVLAAFGFKRISKACTEPERIEDASISEGDVHPQGSIWLDECSFTWSNAEAFSGATAEAALRDVNLKVEPGCLVGIVGSVGKRKVDPAELPSRRR